MTTDPTTTDPANPDTATAGTDRDDAAETAEPAAETPAEGIPTDDPAAALRREAARYRTAARDAATERDGLAERLVTAQRREVERLAGGVRGLADAADLWKDGTELVDLLDEAGDVDPARVTEAVKVTVTAHPHWSARSRVSDIGQGPRYAEPVGPSMADVIGNVRRER